MTAENLTPDGNTTSRQGLLTTPDHCTKRYLGTSSGFHPCDFPRLVLLSQTKKGLVLFYYRFEENKGLSRDGFETITAEYRGNEQRFLWLLGHFVPRDISQKEGMKMGNSYYGKRSSCHRLSLPWYPNLSSWPKLAHAGYHVPHLR